MVPEDQVKALAEEESVGCSPLLQSPIEQSGQEEPFAAEASTAPIQSQSEQHTINPVLQRSNRHSQKTGELHCKRRMIALGSC